MDLQKPMIYPNIYIGPGVRVRSAFDLGGQFGTGMRGHWPKQESEKKKFHVL
jgi:hypothetical protein